MFNGTRIRLARLTVTVSLLLFLAGATIAQPPTAAKSPSKEAQEARLQERTFQSASLDRPMSYRILLPAGYQDGSRRFPVLYLLHGWHGDYKNWSTLTMLVKYAESLPIIIVMPDAADSWYANSATHARDKFETYIAKDLIEEIDQQWPTLRSRDHRAIAGLSMGGYGAVKLALKFPDRFKFAGSLSGAFNATRPELRQSRRDLAPSLEAAYGRSGSQLLKENDVFQIAKRSSPGNQYYFIDCGTRDGDFLNANREFVALIGQRKFDYEYHESPGDHSWEYWNKRLPDLLDAVVHTIVR